MCSGGLNPLKSIGSLFGGSSGGGGFLRGPLAKAASQASTQVGTPETVTTPVGQGVVSPVAQRRKPRSLLGLGALSASQMAPASIASSALKPTLGG